MLLDQETLRFVFGMKLRSLRHDKELSLKELAKKTGLSPSYLNEIEKGRKYPKAEKIAVLANALDEKYENLISLELKKEFQIIQNIIDKRMFSGLPFEIFGIPAGTIFELMAEHPKKIRALVGTILEIARGHNIQVDDVFFALLRSYIDMHENYFPAIEGLAEAVRQKYRINLQASAESIKEEFISILQRDLKVKVLEEDLTELSEDLAGIYYFFSTSSKTLHLASGLNLHEKILILAREIGYRVQKLEARPLSSLILQLDSFEQLLNHFFAGYFASALLIPEEMMVQDCEQIFRGKDWELKILEKSLQKYPVPLESIFHRITQIFPKHFGIKQLFFLRYEYDLKFQKYEIARELHLTSMHGPHKVKGAEHYCARWLISKLTEGMAKNIENGKVATQRSRYVGSDNEYFILGTAYRVPLSDRKIASVCLGLLANEALMQNMPALYSPKIPRFLVGETCERCILTDCSDRKAAFDPQLDPGRYDRALAFMANH